MADTYSDTPWTSVNDVDTTNGLPRPPCGFERQTYKENGVVTHYRFVPECDHSRFPYPVTPQVLEDVFP